MQNYPSSVGVSPINSATPAPRERAVVRQIDMLTACLASQEALIAKLSESLRPAIRPLPTNATVKEPEVLAECELASVLNKLMKRVNYNNTNLEFFIENLEF